MTASLEAIAKERGIKYFLISFTDLFGVQRAKLVPAAAIDEMAEEGAGFAGFATWLDMTPADPDIFAKPDPDSLMQLPWKPEVGWLAADPWMNGEPVAQGAPQRAEAPDRCRRCQGLRGQDRRRMRVLPDVPDGKAVCDTADRQMKPCYDQSA